MMNKSCGPYKNLVESYDYIIEDYSNARYSVSCNKCGSKYRGTITDFRTKQFKCMNCEETKKQNCIEANGFGILEKKVTGYKVKCVNCNHVVTKKYNILKKQDFRCMNCQYNITDTKGSQSGHDGHDGHDDQNEIWEWGGF